MASLTNTSLAPDSAGPTICVGEILVEIVAATRGEGFLEAQALTGPYPSGAPAIFIDQCGRLGGSAAMIGAVGDDDFGRLNTRRLQQDGVDISAVHVDPALPTGSAFVRYRSDGERDFVYNMWTSAAAQVHWTPAVEALVKRAGHLHVIGTLLVHEPMWRIIERAARIVRSHGGTLSLDPNLRKELRSDVAVAGRFAEILSQCDLLLPSEGELTLATGDDDIESAVECLFAGGIKEIAFKQGRDGASVFLPDGTRVRQAAFRADEVDPTGAGDCFGGAYVACRRLGMPVDQALRYACAAGARNVTMAGPMSGAGTRDELDSFIASHPELSS